MKQHIQKVPGGKLLRVKVEHTAVITRVQLLGDFFIHPEDAVAEIERLLVGLALEFDAEVAAQKIRKLVETKHIELIGITPEAIVEGVKMAISQQTQESQQSR